MTESISFRSDIGVIALVPDEWNALWQPRRHIMSRLAQYFNVVWVDPAEHWRTAARGLFDRNAASTQQTPANFTVYRPGLKAPIVYRPAWLKRGFSRSRLRAAGNILRRLGTEKIVLYVWRPQFRFDVEGFPSDLLCYHIDDEYTFSANDEPISPDELYLLRRADCVFIHSPALLEKKGTINPNTSFVPNGVDFAAYSTPVPEPEDLRTIPRPRIGYTGWLKRHLNWELISSLVSANPNSSFVFVGPFSPHPELTTIINALKQKPNVFFLGEKPSDVLAHYPQHFDVCIMPYAVNDYTRYIYPLKLHEYLAGGRPVIGSRIRSLESFGEVVLLADGVGQWDTAIKAALSPEQNTSAAVTARQNIARAHDWEVLTAQVARSILKGIECRTTFRNLPAPDGVLFP